MLLKTPKAPGNGTKTKNSGQGQPLLLLLGIFGFNVACARNIIHGYIVKAGKYQKVINGDPCFAAFVVGICALPDVQEVCDLLLGQGVVFSYFTNAFIVTHKIHHLTQNSIRIFGCYLTNRVISSKLMER